MICRTSASAFITASRAAAVFARGTELGRGVSGAGSAHLRGMRVGVDSGEPNRSYRAIPDYYVPSTSSSNAAAAGRAEMAHLLAAAPNAAGASNASSTALAAPPAHASAPKMSMAGRATALVVAARRGENR